MKRLLIFLTVSSFAFDCHAITARNLFQTIQVVDGVITVAAPANVSSNEQIAIAYMNSENKIINSPRQKYMTTEAVWEAFSSKSWLFDRFYEADMRLQVLTNAATRRATLLLNSEISKAQSDSDAFWALYQAAP